MMLIVLVYRVTNSTAHFQLDPKSQRWPPSLVHFYEHIDIWQAYFLVAFRTFSDCANSNGKLMKDLSSSTHS